MTASFSSSSLVNIPNSKTPSSLIILNPNPFTHTIKIHKSRKPNAHYFISKSVNVDTPSTSTVSSTSSLNLDEGVDSAAIGKVGSKVRVKVPVKVYHVPKVPELDLDGRIGTLKQYVAIYKGKQISANYPYKVEFVVDDLVEGRSGPVKFSVHLREDEFEFLD